MSDSLTSKDFLLDKRIVQRNISTHRTEKSKYEEFLSSLPDLENECEDISRDVFDTESAKVALAGDYVKTREEENEE